MKKIEKFLGHLFDKYPFFAVMFLFTATPLLLFLIFAPVVILSLLFGAPQLPPWFLLVFPALTLVGFYKTYKDLNK